MIVHSTAQINSVSFVEFMLGVINQTLRQQTASEEKENGQNLNQRLELQLESRLESNIAAKDVLFVRDQSLSKSELAALMVMRRVSCV